MPWILSKFFLCGRSCGPKSRCCPQTRNWPRFGNPGEQIIARNNACCPLWGRKESWVGVVTRHEINERIEQDRDSALECSLGELAQKETIEAYPGEPLRVVVYRMAEKDGDANAGRGS